MGNEHKFESDICAQCQEAGTIVMPTGETYRVCAPEKSMSHEYVVRQLVTLEKPAIRTKLPKRLKDVRQPQRSLKTGQ
jgi:hypothetical protein